MDLSYGEQYDAYRQQVRDFLRASWPPEGADEAGPAAEQEKIFRRKAVDQGYCYRHIPRRYGGAERERDLIEEEIIREEFFDAGAPLGITGVGPAMLVPTLLERGTQEQRDQFIEATLHGEIRWCQGYSEPGSGSDLASLASRAELDGDEWVIHGQKIWTSSAHLADWMFGLFRTEPDEPRHAGITYLLLPVKQPGVEIRPLKQITGESHFNEVFFDGARTHVRYQVGARGEGWNVSRTTLKHERNMLGDPRRLQNLFDDLVELARTAERAGRPAIEDPGVRRGLAKLQGFVMSQQFSGYRQLTYTARGDEGEILAPTLMNKLYTTELVKKMAVFAYDLIDGDDGLERPEPVGSRIDQRASDTRGWTLQYLMSHAAAIAGGSSNIQRNIIGERALGMPRDLRKRP